MTDAESLPREDVAVGTICEYNRDGTGSWVIVVREPRSIHEYDDATGRESIPEGWSEFEPEETDVIHFVPLDGKDDVIARLEGADLDGHRAVATELFTRDDVHPLVAPLPHFTVLGPTKQATAGESPVSDRGEYDVE